MLTPDPRQRKRTTRACDQCKIGRKRCQGGATDGSTTGGHGPCEACRKANQNCTYTIPARRRGPIPAREVSYQHYTPEEADDILYPLYPSIGVNERHITSTSSSSLALEPAHRVSARAQNSGHDLPSDVVDKLLVIYFTHVHNLWPIVYKPHFTLATTSLPLLRAMLCVAACVVPKPERDRYDSEVLFRAAEQSVRDCWAQPQIEAVQSILLLSLRQTGCGDKQSAFGFAAQACTLALSLGLNNAVSRTEDPGEAHTQIRSRVWWSCYLMDKCLAEETGRPCLLRYKGCTTPLPAVDEMDELEMWPPLPVTSAPLPKSVDNVKPRRGHIISAFVWTCRLAMIVENILDLEWQGPPAIDAFDTRFRAETLSLQSPDRVAGVIAGQLADFRGMLPRHLDRDLSASIPPLPQVAIMIAWHATATILFYARYIQPRSESMFGQFNDDHSTLHVSAYTKCAEASQTVIDAIQQLDRYQLLREACADFLYIISLTTLFQTFECTNPDQSIAERSKENLTRCCRWLREFSSSWPAASAQKLFFEGLIQGGMRLSSPDGHTSNADQTSSTLGTSVAGPDTSPVQRTSTSFPSVHRALYAVQGHRLGQSSELVDIANLLQLPQFYWNNWNQWISNDAGGTTVGSDPLHDEGIADTSKAVEPVWDMSTVAPSGGIAGAPGSQDHPLPSVSGPEGPDQNAVTAALLRYMMEGAQGAC